MTKLVGILNVTPDSFSDGGAYFSPAAAIARAQQLFADGVAFVDVGAESTRPHAQALSDDEEWARLKPVLAQLLSQYPGKLSVDTYHPTTIERACGLGPIIINDVTGFQNPAMQDLAVSHNLPVIISHLPNMSIQDAHRRVPVSTVSEVTSDLLATAALLQKRGLSADRIILDPGIGFGKTPELNWELLKFAHVVPSYPVMIGYSRKRFLGEHRLELAPNLAAARIAIAHGAAYLRVHDVAGHSVLI
jgi:dihydropteroate synthase